MPRPQGTRRQNPYQGTRQQGFQDPEMARRHSFLKPRPRSEEVKENMDWTEDEIDRLWTALRGGGSAKATMESGMRLSQALDHFGRPTRLYNPSAGEGGAWINAAHLGTLTTQVEGYWVPAESYAFSPGISAPAEWNYGLGSSRLAGIDIGTGSSAVFLWHSGVPRGIWTDETRINTRMFYSLNVAGENPDVIRMVTSGYGYSAGDALTSPTVQWNETHEVDLTGVGADSIQFVDLPEAASTLSTVDYIQYRMNFSRNNAAYTYVDTVSFYGALYTPIREAL